jgi:Fe-Mn family superoxide dismutase
MPTIELPELPYAKDALAPHMSAETLEYHYGKHHQGYVNKSQSLIKGTGLEDKTDEEVMKAAYANPQHTALFNNFAQYYNHKHFWNWMTPNGGGTNLPDELEDHLKRDFGSVSAFLDEFKKAATGQFGSGWAWLSMDQQEKLHVMNTPNGENPVVHDQIPLLGLDVWEHSYYLDHRNARGEYVDTFLNNLVNWDYVEELHQDAHKQVKAAA